MQQEQWVDEVMSSLKGLQKAEGNLFLHTRVLAKLEKQASLQGASLKPVYALASAVFIVLVLNVFLWNQSDSVTIETNAVSTTVNEYDLTAIDY